jgi:hypothetical protein
VSVPGHMLSIVSSFELPSFLRDDVYAECAFGWEGPKRASEEEEEAYADHETHLRLLPVKPS